MKEKAWNLSCVGMVHKGKNISCEDYSDSGEIKGMKFIVVSDGAGSLENSKEGAVIAAKAVVEYIADNFERLLIEDIARLKFFIMSHITFSLKQKAGGRDIKAFGSTVVFLGMKNKKYIMFHLGDGAVIAGNENKYSIISKPMNGETKKHTWLTTTPEAHKFARIDRGEATEEFYAAVSDGCYDMFKNTDKGIMLWNSLVNENSGEKIKECIEADCMDDFSFSVMSV